MDVADKLDMLEAVPLKDLLDLLENAGLNPPKTIFLKRERTSLLQQWVRSRGRQLGKACI